MPIKLYRATISPVWHRSEHGDYFTDRPLAYQDRNYIVETTPTPERVLHLAEGVGSDAGQFGDTVLSHPDGTTILLTEAIKSDGRLIARKWGRTERLKP